MVKKNETKKPVAVKKDAAPKKIATVAEKKVAEKKPTKKASRKKSASVKEYPYVELVHPLLTQDYTKILLEGSFKFNAPHLFKVIKAEPETTGKNKGNNLVVGIVHFQEGPIKENGVNGVSNEDLLGMVLVRLEHFQNSAYRCRENALAITKIEEALMWLRKRTNARVTRGVEGTSNV